MKTATRKGSLRKQKVSGHITKRSSVQSAKKKMYDIHRHLEQHAQNGHIASVEKKKGRRCALRHISQQDQERA